MDMAQKTLVESVISTAFNEAYDLGISSYSELKDFILEFIIDRGFTFVSVD